MGVASSGTGKPALDALDDYFGITDDERATQTRNDSGPEKIQAEKQPQEPVS
jgi:hypothetical protein